jgi:di/tricarboxylate transporter
VTIAAIITLLVIVGAIILFATELVSIDLTAILIMITLILFGIITPEEGVQGFSNNATITVAFMFVISAAMLKTGALQYLAHRLSSVFRNNFHVGLLMMMLLIAVVSAFMNNTPVVAVFIPVVMQIAHSSGQNPSKMLIPLSFASIFGGTATLIGTSTNILVSGIAEKEGLEPISMFQMTPIAIILIITGITYMIFIGIKLLPNRKNEDLESKFDLKDYLSEIEITKDSSAIGKQIMDTDLVKELDMDIIEVRRKEDVFLLPQGDFKLQLGDILKVKCSVEKLKELKDKAKMLNNSIKVAENDLRGKNSTIVELVISANSDFENKTLKEVDFRRRFRGIPLAIRHREEVIHDQLYNIKLKAGDVILAEIKTHYIKELKKLERMQDAPFIFLSEENLIDFNRKNFVIVLTTLLAIITLAALNILNIMVGVILAVVILVLSKCINMKELYDSINWKIVFLLAGSLSLGTAMKNSGLDQHIAGGLINQLGQFGPIVVLSGLYLVTSLLTEIMSNNATAALITPIAIATALKLDVSVTPFLIAIMLAASSSFMTPIGYQTNTMVYSAGQYKFIDFIKVGTALNILFWILATIFIPLFFKF